MKILSLALLVMASLAFVVLGCADNASPVEVSTDQALSSPTSPAALAKGGWDMMATGSGGQWWEGSHWTFAFTAQKDADGVKGQIQVYDRTWGGKFHLEVTHLDVVGNQAYMVGYGMLPEIPKEFFGAPENIPPGPGYGMVLLTDNGQGIKAELPDQQSYFVLFPDNGNYVSEITALATASVGGMKDFWTAAGWPEEWFLWETNMGNTVIRSR